MAGTIVAAVIPSAVEGSALSSALGIKNGGPKRMTRIERMHGQPHFLWAIKGSEILDQGIKGSEILIFKVSRGQRS